MEKENVEENIFTDIINYARNKLSSNDGVKYENLVKFLKEKGYSEVEDEESHEYRSMISCLRQNFHRYGKPEHESKCRYYLTSEAFFGSLNHDSYTHSIETARSSKKLSLLAIGISSVLALLSVVLSIIQLVFC